MDNNTLLNVTIPPLQVNATPPLLSYIIPTLISSSLLLFFIFLPQIRMLFLNLLNIRLLRRISQNFNMNVIVMNHKNAGFFGSMITMDDVMKFENLLRKFNYRDVAFIINTYGGDLFASMRLATLVRRYNIDVYIPKFAWSGGTLASLGAGKIF